MHPEAPKIKQSRPRLPAIGLLIALASTTSPALRAAAAQSTVDQSAPVGALQEITVTATRRKASAQRVPISIAVLNSRYLAQNEIVSIADVAAATPGLQFSTPLTPSTITTISIRGINDDTGPYTTGIYLDDTPLQGRLSSYGDSGSPIPIVFDLDRVEVLRGPQGTLFGSGSEAGTIRFITNTPSLTDFSGDADGEYSYTEDGSPSYGASVALGGPIVNNELGFRVAAYSREDGGYIDLANPLTQATVEPNVNRDYKRAFRAALVWEVGAIEIDPAIYYQATKQDDSGHFQGYFSDPAQGDFVNEPFLPEASTDHWALPTLAIKAGLPFADLTSTTSYLHRELNISLDYGNVFFSANPDGLPVTPPPGPTVGYGSSLAYDLPTSPTDAVPSYAGQRDQAVTQEVRLVSNNPNAFFTWVAGAFYQHYDQQDWQNSMSAGVNPSDSAPAGTTIFYENQFYTDEQLALYGQGDLHLTRKWTATLGLRVARDKTDYSVVAPAATAAPLTANLQQTPTTPHLGISYQLTPASLVYATASKGYRMGGGNGTLLSQCDFDAPTAYKSDYLWNYEIGTKNTLFGDRLEVNADVFHDKWYNIQELIVLGNCGLSYTGNTGDATSNGFDLSVRAAFTDELSVSASVGYADAYFSKDYYIPTTSQLLIQSGDKIGYLPQVNAPWNINISPEYRLPLGNDHALHFNAEYLYTSRNPGPFITQIPGSPDYLPLATSSPATSLFNLRGGYTVGNLDTSLFLNNVFNSHPLLNPVENLTDSSKYEMTYTTFRPRTIGVSVNYSF
jgi:iron complex outermembrane recepter protein